MWQSESFRINKQIAQLSLGQIGAIAMLGVSTVQVE